MDCKLESAAKTYLRIEVLILQGFLHGLCMMLIGFIEAPFVPFFVVVSRFIAERNKMKLWKRIVFLPWWFVSGILFAIANPIGIFIKTFYDIREIARIEWMNRWMCGKPKMPNGTPANVMTDEEKEKMSMEITKGVIRDYNEEAKEYGQGVDIPD